jgi:endonuclease YncB( thermonuclease family)
MIRYVFYVFALVTFKVVFPARAQSLPVLVGTVIKIVDGDTIDVELTSGPIGVRLHGIDTPERGQPWAKESTAALAALVAGKEVAIEPFGRDHYDRMIGIIYRDDLNINLELVKRGHAWAYREYILSPDNTPAIPPRRIRNSARDRPKRILPPQDTSPSISIGSHPEPLTRRPSSVRARGFRFATGARRALR